MWRVLSSGAHRQAVHRKLTDISEEHVNPTAIEQHEAGNKVSWTLQMEATSSFESTHDFQRTALPSMNTTQSSS
jgi:hypothetical protein